MSHLLQMRGLKQWFPLKDCYLPYVASFTDAWIETPYIQAPTAEAGVASFTDAWIETNSYSFAKSSL